MVQSLPLRKPPQPLRSSSFFVQRIRTITALILREMSVRYGKSPGGYIWAILEPAGGLIVLSIGFSVLLRSPSLGNNFLLFYATAYMPFLLFQSISKVTANSLVFSRSLLRYPLVHWTDTVFARLILHSLTGVLVAAIIIGGAMAYSKHNSLLDFGAIFLSFSASILMGFGIGLTNAFLFGVVPVWRSVWQMLMRPLMIASAILYIYEDLPTLGQDILWFNPLVHTSTLAREGFYQIYAPQNTSLVYIFSIGLISTTIGLLFLRRYHLTVLEKR